MCIRDRLCECSRIVDSQFGQHLSVDIDAGFLQAVDQSAVGDIVHSCSSVDSCDPQFSVVSLLVLSAYVCGTKSSHRSRLSSSECLALGTVVAFRHL